MEAITILKNESNNHSLLQIDLDMPASDHEQLEDVTTSLLLNRKMKRLFLVC